MSLEEICFLAQYMHIRINNTEKPILLQGNVKSGFIEGMGYNLQVDYVRFTGVRC